MFRTARALAVLTITASLGAQSSVPIPLDYNFNGIVHAGEAGQPDAPNGFRSISDRALDFSSGVPNEALLNGYELVGTANTLDIVHLGNRNTVDFGNRPFDASPDGDDFGTQPAWLANADQSSPQTTDLAASGNSIALGAAASASFLYQISNGGGSFDVTIGFLGGGSHSETLSGPDWFGGAYAARSSTDIATPGPNLSVTEGVIDLSAYAGQVIESISFDNGSNPNAGYAILAGRVDSDAVPAPEVPIPLNYNFNGIVHAGEDGNPNDPNGFRSISDRALDFRGGVPSDAVLDRYELVDTPGALDIVHLGNRNLVDFGNRPFDTVVDNDDFGVQPAWLQFPDQALPQVTSTKDSRVALVANSEASLLFQISNGGGGFDVTFAFLSGNALTQAVSGPDWFGGSYAGMDSTDDASPGANLRITERTIDLSAYAGEVLDAVFFWNRTNSIGGYAILAVNVRGCASPASITNLGGGNGPTVSTSSATIGSLFEFTVNGAGPLASGTVLGGSVANALPLSLVFPACAGDLVVSSPDLGVAASPDASGSYTLMLMTPADPGLCGASYHFQYGEIAIGPPCPIVMSDAVRVTFGY